MVTNARALALLLSGAGDGRSSPLMETTTEAGLREGWGDNLGESCHPVRRQAEGGVPDATPLSTQMMPLFLRMENFFLFLLQMLIYLIILNVLKIT